MNDSISLSYIDIKVSSAKVIINCTFTALANLNTKPLIKGLPLYFQNIDADPPTMVSTDGYIIKMKMMSTTDNSAVMTSSYPALTSGTVCTLSGQSYYRI